MGSIGAVQAAISKAHEGVVLICADLRQAVQERDVLKEHLAAMCGWAELLAEERGWERANAAAYYASLDAARRSVGKDEHKG